MYTCQVTLTIAGVDRFIETADSTVIFTGTPYVCKIVITVYNSIV